MYTVYSYPMLMVRWLWSPTNPTPPSDQQRHNNKHRKSSRRHFNENVSSFRRFKLLQNSTLHIPPSPKTDGFHHRFKPSLRVMFKNPPKRDKEQTLYHLSMLIFGQELAHCFRQRCHDTWIFEPTGHRNESENPIEKFLCFQSRHLDISNQ